MQKILLTIIAFFILINAFGQKTEFRISLNSGLFFFTGPSAKSTSYINLGNSLNSGYTNNPFGTKRGLCDGLSANVQWIIKKHFIAGLDAGYEVLRSKVLITQAGGSNVKGQTFLEYKFINIHPFVGYKINIRKLFFNITGGLDIAYCLDAWENGSATAADGTKFTSSLDRKSDFKKDLRSRIQFATGYKNVGIYFGYSHGWANYMSGYIGGNPECYARLIRFGLTYKIK